MCSANIMTRLLSICLLISLCVFANASNELGYNDNCEVLLMVCPDAPFDQEWTCALDVSSMCFMVFQNQCQMNYFACMENKVYLNYSPEFCALDGFRCGGPFLKK